MTAPRVVVAIQARVGSTRLPRKVLAEVAGRPMLRFQLDRLRPLRCDELVVATSDLPADDEVAALAEHVGVDVVRGSESDVLARFARVIDRYQPDVVVRLTGDCPLADPAIVSAVVDLHLRSGAAYTSNVHPRSFPKGLDCEVASAAALLEADSEAVDPDEREHVMPFLQRRPDRYPTANLAADEDLSDLWWTVDTAADLEHVRRLVSLVPDPVTASWRDVLVAAQAANLTS